MAPVDCHLARYCGKLVVGPGRRFDTLAQNKPWAKVSVRHPGPKQILGQGVGSTPWPKTNLGPGCRFDTLAQQKVLGQVSVRRPGPTKSLGPGVGSTPWPNTPVLGHGPVRHLTHVAGVGGKGRPDQCPITVLLVDTRQWTSMDGHAQTHNLNHHRPTHRHNTCPNVSTNKSDTGRDRPRHPPWPCDYD